MSDTKRMIIAALCMALCVVLPMAFHAVPNAGSIFLPMHIPVLLCGLICGWKYGLACGLIGPLLSSLITGMPPIAYLPSMLCELAAYGFISGFFSEKLHISNYYWKMMICLISVMLIGRVFSGILRALIFARGSYSIGVWTASYFVTSFPGIIIQLVLIPALITALKKSKLIN